MPPKLVRIYQEEKENTRATARRLEVNPGLLWKLLFEGTEPKDPDIRKKLFLPGKFREPLPAWVVEGTENLARLEGEAGYRPITRVYDRNGKQAKKS